jgi:hypothetical protein
MKLADLTPEQRTAICNGVGPAHFGWLFPGWIASNHVFKHAADGHDLAYWIGGGIRDRLKADNAFLLHCLQAAVRQGLCSMWFIPAAFVYWLAVRIGGAPAFHYGTQRGECDLPKRASGHFERFFEPLADLCEPSSSQPEKGEPS